MYNPIATYRIQFHKEFTFRHFEQIISYLQKLGVSTVYGSPIFEATPGSTHGYDGVHPHNINPEIGTNEQLTNISARLKKEQIGWLQDIVPNHMAFHPNNVWLMDVLEKGQQSAYAKFFDIGWENGKLMVPFLGASLEEVINNGELKIELENDKFVFKYYDSVYPIQGGSHITILEQSSRRSEAIEAVNNSPELLKQLADEQHYRLCHWQETDSKINYRRFFTINGLICLNIQDKDVFSAYHKIIQQYVSDGTFQGLRIDHIDGLYDPERYLQDLRELAGDETYITVEKILEPGESLPANWPVQGTTGYDFLGLVNNLFTNQDAKDKFTKFYNKLTGSDTSIHQQLHDKKAAILYNHMNGELENLCSLFKSSKLASEEELAEIGDSDLKSAIGDFLIQCPVYRFYGNSLPLNKQERKEVDKILERIKDTKAELKPAISLLEKAIQGTRDESDETQRQKALYFYQRCMQFTGPLMAKGVEDTLMYTYNRFIGHNDVGDSPEAFGMSAEDFHTTMAERQQNWPLAMNATSTHDTKRGEDVRARLNVLTDLDGEWLKRVKEWQRLNRKLKENNAPDSNDEYFIYQTLSGAYPMPDTDEDNLIERLEAYLQKALREAKVHSNWTSPNEAYETATANFIKGLLKKDTAFWKSFTDFQKLIADHGIVNSLSQLLLKFTCPGVPDVYQGTELWDLSLVDPDNRRRVDYHKRLSLLDSFGKKESEELFEHLWNNRYDGSIKLWLTNLLLNERKEHADLFSKGKYIPLQVKGKYKENVLAFARSYKKQWCIVAVPLHTAQLCQKQQCSVFDIDWKNTRILLPDEPITQWINVADKSNAEYKGEISIGQLFNRKPFALLRSNKKMNSRDAGILLAISSLPSPYGIGDLGPEAKSFADFLYRCCQSYWQLLPLNPTSMDSGHSPYSSISSMAGNTLFLNPDLLMKANLLDVSDIKEAELPAENEASYGKAEKIKNELFNKAYENYKKEEYRSLKSQFEQFCTRESYWLDDFALYVVLKQQHEGKPWYQWPDAYKQRDADNLEQFQAQHADEINKVKWLQLLFSLQWQELRAYCNDLGIKLFGDLPFYVSYDSVDVWSHPDIFCLDKDGNMTGVAGVPPDYFSEDGQLWGMPTFNWHKLKEDNYSWWVSRLKKNLELFDIVRLDHFRAFAEYWQVPAGEETARNGKWLPGPGVAFFDVLRDELGGLPFIAEDLGDNMDPVYELRDKLGLPGMKVLQFAFGEHMPDSVDIPHNYTPNCIVYTGTHDNNTTVGWYHQEANNADHKRLEQYVGSDVRIKNVHKMLGRMAYASVAKTAIVPMQDLLGLDAAYRMNTPGQGDGNWLWRLKPGQLTGDIEELLRNWTKFYNRY